MPYKTILVHVDDSKDLQARAEFAARIAVAESGHVIAHASTGASRILFETRIINPTDAKITPFLELLRQQTEAALARFADIAQRNGAASVETRITDEESIASLSLEARYCDLLVVGQKDPERPDSSFARDYPEVVIINSGVPALVVPYQGHTGGTLNRALIAWNGSVEATRALHYALPLLQRAKIVEVAIFNPPEQPDAVPGEPPGTALKHYLSRQHIRADVRQESTEDDIGEALLSLAANLGSDLLVMGCYGHSRLREILLGGTTRTLLESAPIPVLMAH